MPSSTGPGSVSAAGAVVVKSVAPYTIVGGNPAKPIRQRFPDALVEQLLKLQWWHRSDAEINQIVPLLQQPLDQAVFNQIEAVLRADESQFSDRAGLA